MTTIRALGTALRETLRLFAADPLGMVAVAYMQLTLDREGAQKRIQAIIQEHPKDAAQENKR